MQRIILGVWLIIIILDYARYGYVWQLKEYRWRNMVDYLQTKKGRQLIFRPVFFSKSFIRPTLTNKVALIFLMGFVFELSLVYLFSFNLILLLTLVLFRFGVISFLVALLHVPTMIVKRFYIYLAAKKIRKYKNLKVVGITGSYAKTTTKELLSQVLSMKFSVVKTPSYINTEIGIARFILQTDFSQIDIFVVEMGAYKQGDIKLIADMVKPEVGILTAINEQHLSLFGDLKKTQLTKYELLESLPAKGLAVVNADCKLCMELLSKVQAEVVTFGKSKEADYSVENVSSGLNGISFECKKEEYRSQLIGRHNALNLVVAIIVAEYFGMTINEIKKVVNEVESTLNNTQVQRLGRAKILKDTHNANPVGFLAMLEMVYSLRGDKQKIIVITRGINELGVKSKEKHLQISEKINEVADVLVVISPDHEQYLREKITNKNIKVKTIFDGNDLLEYVKEVEQGNNMILFANKLFSNIEEYLVKNIKK